MYKDIKNNSPIFLNIYFHFLVLIFNLRKYLNLLYFCVFISTEKKTTELINYNLLIFCKLLNLLIIELIFPINRQSNDAEMCNFYIMYWTRSRETLKQKYCISPGPPLYYWIRDFNTLPKGASKVPLRRPNEHYHHHHN